MTKFLRKAIILKSILKSNFKKTFLMKIEIIMPSKGIFMEKYSVRPKKNIVVIVMSNLFMTRENFGKP